MVATHEIRSRLCRWSLCQLCLRQIGDIYTGETTLGETLRSGSSRVDNLLRVSKLTAGLCYVQNLILSWNKITVTDSLIKMEANSKLTYVFFLFF